jgi:hypothetical protein
MSDGGPSCAVGEKLRPTQRPHARGLWVPGLSDCGAVSIGDDVSLEPGDRNLLAIADEHEPNALFASRDFSVSEPSQIVSLGAPPAGARSREEITAAASCRADRQALDDLHGELVRARTQLRLASSGRLPRTGRRNRPTCGASPAGSKRGSSRRSRGFGRRTGVGRTGSETCWASSRSSRPIRQPPTPPLLR